MISEEAATDLISAYVAMRRMGGSKRIITATPRQLESLIRLSEAHARMRLSAEVEPADVAEAVRLMKVATQSAATDPTTGMCTSVQDTCVAAYHDCPHNGISLQVDSEGITIPQEEKHNQILYARCQCINKWSGADCSIDPPKPPTEEPWPDPYAAAAQSGAGRDAAPVAAALAAALAAAAFGRRRRTC